MTASNFRSRDTYLAAIKRGTHPPQHAQKKLDRIERRYRLANRHFEAFKESLLIKLVGEERYMAGPLLPWKKNTRGADAHR
jgi:hypothetical protein